MICQRIDCGREATCAPRIHVPAMRRPGVKPLTSVLTLVCCAQCMGELAAADFVGPGDRGREALRQALALVVDGRFVPDFDAAWLEPVALTSADWLAVERARAGRLQ